MNAPSRKYNPGFLTADERVASYCVRTTELELLVEVLRECTGRSNPHQIVIGPRGSGKTSLLLRVVAEVGRDAALASRFFPIVFAEESYEVATAGEFWLECLTNLAAQAPRGEDTPDLNRTVAELRTIRDDQALSDRCLGALLDFADQEAKRLVLVVENLNMLFADMADPEAGWRLRKILQTEPRIIVFASATSRFNEIDNPDRALYDLFRDRTLRPLDNDECTALWKSVSGRHPAPQTIRSLKILTGGSPRLISILARFGAGLSFRDLMSDLFALVDEHTEYFKSHIESLPAQERRVYLALATLWKPATTREIADHARLETSTCSAQLARLGDRGVVQVAGGSARRKQYYLTERLYNIYYLLRRRLGPDPLVEALIHFMESYYSPPELKDIRDRMVRDTTGLGTEMWSLYQPLLARLTVLPALALADIRDLASEARYQDVVRDCDKLIERFRESENLADPQMVAAALAEKAVAFNLLNNSSDALAVCDQVVQRFGDSDNRELLQYVAKALVSRAYALIVSGEPHNALSICDEVIQRFGAGDTPAMIGHVAMARTNKAAALCALNRAQDALAVYDQAIQRLGDSDTTEMLESGAVALINKAAVLYTLQRPEDALAAYDEAIKHFGQSDNVGIRRNVATAATDRGAVLWALKRPQEALAACDRAIERYEHDSDPELRGEVAMALATKGSVFRELNQPQEALAAWDEILERFGNSDTPKRLLWCVAMALVRKAEALRALKRPTDALAAYDAVVSGFGEGKWPTALIAEGLLERATITLAEGDVQEALGLFVVDGNVLSTRNIETLMDLSVNLGPRRLIELIQGSPAADLLLPLTTALELELGNEARVAREVKLVAQDIGERLKNLKKKRG